MKTLACDNGNIFTVKFFGGGRDRNHPRSVLYCSETRTNERMNGWMDGWEESLMRRVGKLVQYQSHFCDMFSINPSQVAS